MGTGKKAKEEERKGTSLVPLDPLQRYLAEIRRYSLLTREEERSLAPYSIEKKMI